MDAAFTLMAMVADLAARELEGLEVVNCCNHDGRVCFTLADGRQGDVEIVVNVDALRPMDDQSLVT